MIEIQKHDRNSRRSQQTKDRQDVGNVPDNISDVVIFWLKLK